MWCPSCGDEFREGYTRCNDCDVPLVLQRPAGVSGRRPRPLPWACDQRVEFDLAHWPDGRRQNLDAWLVADNIPAVWETETLLVAARTRANEVDDLIRLLDSEAAAAAPPPVADSPVADDEPPLDQP